MEKPTIEILANTFLQDEASRITATLEKGSVREFMLMQKDEVRLRFNHPEAVTLHRGDFVELPGAGIYEVMDESQRPNFDIASGAFVFDITLHARYRKFAERIHRFSTDASSPETKWSLTDTCQRHGERIIASMNALADKDEAFRPWEKNSKGENRWELEVDGVIVDTAKCITITYDGTKILDAIDEIAREFECEWWFEGATLHLGKCRHSNAVAVRAGVELGKVSRSDSSESKATRIYFQGSTRNIPSTYRHTLLLRADATSSIGKGGEYHENMHLFRDTLRNIPDEAFTENSRAYNYDELQAESMEFSSMMFDDEYLVNAYGILTIVKTGWGGSSYISLRKFPVQEGWYRVDLDRITFKIHDYQTKPNGISARYAVRIRGFKEKDSYADYNLVYTKIAYGSWFSLTSMDSSGNVVIQGGKHEFYAQPNAKFLDVEIYLEANVSAEATIPFRCKITPEINTEKDHLGVHKPMPCLCPYDRYHFSASVTIQFRDSKGNPQGDPISGVMFNTAKSSLPEERWFMTTASKMAMIPALPAGETYRYFTIEQGVDLPFVPASMWTSDTVLRNGVEATVAGVAERRLLLPLKDENGNDLHGYLDTRPDLTEAEVMEEVKTLDDCYPGTETTITSLEQTTQTYTDTYETTDGSEEKKTWKAWMFKCAIFDNKPFSKRYLLDNEKLQATFQEGTTADGGRLNGMIFDLIARDDGYMEIVRDSDALLPNDAVCPRMGDKLIITGFDVRMFSDADNDLIAQAEMKLLEKARAIVSDINTDASTYEGEILCDIAREQIPGFDTMMLTPGHRVALTIPEYGLDRFVTRVLGFSIPIDIEYDNPRFTFGEQTAYSRLASLEDKLNGIDRATHARAGGEAMGDVPYDKDCYAMLERTFVQLPEDGRPSDAAPLDIRAYMVIDGKRAKAQWVWTSEAEGTKADFIKDDADPNASILRITALPEGASIVTIKATAASGEAKADAELQIAIGAQGGHLHTMTVSHPVVSFGSTNEGGMFARPVKVIVRTLTSGTEGMNPTQDGFLMMRTDADATWASVPREQGVAEITILDLLSAFPAARRIDLAFYCPKYDESNIVAESSIFLLETLMASVDRGQWEAGAQYYAGDLNPETDIVEISYVWYMGCKYRCLATGTTDAPLWDSPDWDMVEGDPALRLEWLGSEDTVYADDPKITLSLRAIIFNQDVTTHARTRWDWSRESFHGSTQNTLEDAAWSANHQNQGEYELSLVEADMNYHAGQHPDKLVYTAKATIRDAQGQVFKTQAYKIEF